MRRFDIWLLIIWGKLALMVMRGCRMGSASVPSIYMQLAGREPFVLGGRPDYSSSEDILGEPLVGMLLRS